MLYKLLILLLSFDVSAEAYNITWKAPTERENGIALVDSEIDHFHIYWGNAPGDYQVSIPVTRKNKYPFPTSHEVDIEIGKNYYFVITTFDIEGRESLYSNEIKLITAKPPAAIELTCKPNADLNGDGIVNAADLAIMKTRFFKEF